jgi:hypothetical protein
MRYETYLKRMKKHDDAFQNVWLRILKDTNAYVESNPEKTGYGMNSDSNNPLSIAEHILFNGVWIIDRIEGVEKGSRQSLRYKVRKAVGYTYPDR